MTYLDELVEVSIEELKVLQIEVLQEGHLIGSIPKVPAKC